MQTKNMGKQDAREASCKPIGHLLAALPWGSLRIRWTALKHGIRSAAIALFITIAIVPSLALAQGACVIWTAVYGEVAYGRSADAVLAKLKNRINANPTMVGGDPNCPGSGTRVIGYDAAAGTLTTQSIVCYPNWDANLNAHWTSEALAPRTFGITLYGGEIADPVTYREAILQSISQTGGGTRFDELLEAVSSCIAPPPPPPDLPPTCPAQDGASTPNPILPATGEKIKDETDYAGSGPHALDLVRHYRGSRASSASTAGLLGQTWSLDYIVNLRAGDDAVVLTLGNGNVRTFTPPYAGGGGSIVYPVGDVTMPSTTSPDTLIGNSLGNGLYSGWRYYNSEDDSTWVFDSTGKLLSQTQRNGWVRSYTYNTASQLTRITNQFGLSLGFAYNSAGKLGSITTPDAQVIGYTYDSVGRLSGVNYPGGTSRAYLYENASYPQALTGIVDETGQRSTYTYDSAGRALSSELASGADRYQVSYPASSGAPTVVTDPLGTQRSYSYSTQQGKLAVTGASQPGGDATSSMASRVQTSLGLLDSETDFLGVTTLYTWNAARRLKTGQTRAAGRPESQTVQTQWHATWRLPVLVTEAGRSTAYTYDGQGNKLSETVTDTASGTARTWAWSYTGAGLVASETAPNGGVTQYAYDSAGNATSITNALGHVTALQYDTAGRLTQSTAPTGLVTTYGYDARGRLLSHNRGGLVTSYTYTPSGQVASASLPSGYQLSYSYDPAQRLIGWADNRGAQGEFTLDAMGNRTLEQIKQGSIVVWQLARSINSLNRISSETLGVNQARSYGYNANGDKTSDTNGLSQGTSYALDGLKRVTAITNAANATAQLTYNALDGVTAASDFKGAATGYARDAFGGATQEASPDAGTRATQYGPLGLPSQITDALGQATAIQRDSLGRPTQLSFADGKSTVLRYDLTGGTYNESGSPRASRGYLSEIIDASGTTQYKRDLQGRVIVKSQLLANGSTRRVRYSYTAGGQLDTLTYPNGGRLQHLYDATGRLAQLNWNDKPLITGISWNPLGQPTAWTWAFADNNDDTSIPASRSYDSAGRLTATEISSYQYDAAGRITSLTQELYKPANSNPNGKTVVAANVTWSVGYDVAGRIVSFGNGTSQASFSYDANGNRLTSVQSTGTGSATQNISRAYSVDGTGNKLLGFTQHSSGASGSASTSIGYQYNANGDLIHDGLRSYGFNAEGRLSSVTTGNTTTAPTTRYAHNALGQRVFKTEPLYPSTQGDESDPGFLQSLIAFFSRLWNPGASPAEQLGWVYVYGEDGSLLGEYGMGGASSTGSAKHIYLPTASGPLPIAALINGRKYAVHTDHLNTPRRLSQANGKAVWQWAYSAFGDEQPTTAANRFTGPNTTPTTGTTGSMPVTFNLRYPGQYYDAESGLFYNYFRSYSPTTGHYSQPDPIGLNGGWNRFGYVDANPLGFVDPEGLQAYTGQTPPPDIPGGPWTPQAGQRPGAFQGPANPNGGARDMCQYVPDESNGGPRGAREGYWKTKEPGKPWTRFDLRGNPITPEQAHPGNPQPGRPGNPFLGVPGSMPIYPLICPLCNVVMPPSNGPS